MRQQGLTRLQGGPEAAETKAPPSVAAAHTRATRTAPKCTSSRKESASQGRKAPARCRKSVCRNAAPDSKCGLGLGSGV